MVTLAQTIASGIPRVSAASPPLLAFPTSLSVVKLAGLAEQVDPQTAQRLTELERDFNARVVIAPILEANNTKGYSQALDHALGEAVDYYFEAAPLIWRALKHDYDRLLRVSEASTKSINKQFFQNADKLDRRVFINAVAGLRVLSKVGECVMLQEKAAKHEKGGDVAFFYLAEHMTPASFLLWCLLWYLMDGATKAQRANLKRTADFIFGLAEEAHKRAQGEGLFAHLSDAQRVYWQPASQQGEVEADLDILQGRVKDFPSVSALLEDLKGKR